MSDSKKELLDDFMNLYAKSKEAFEGADGKNDEKIKNLLENEAKA